MLIIAAAAIDMLAYFAIISLMLFFTRLCFLPLLRCFTRLDLYA